MKYAFVDYRISKEEERSLNNHNIHVIKVPQNKNLYKAIDGHTDIQIFQSEPLKNQFIINKDIDIDFINTIMRAKVMYSFSNDTIKEAYPHDIILNAISTKSLLMHKLDSTDPSILSLCTLKEKINISQGYSKCSCAIVNDHAFITSDNGIYKKLKSKNYDVLLLPPGDIILENLNYGFIGGACGLISQNEMAFFGSLEKYKYGKLVKNFLQSQGITPIYLSNGPLIDRGSIFVFSNDDIN